MTGESMTGESMTKESKRSSSQQTPHFDDPMSRFSDAPMPGFPDFTISVHQR
jgi:hypothetical protein